ncbi:MAG: 50S ribosomal protein L17 [Planctomycetes bacterium]|nr:50S ribosomal protein L17 [Planctomycetota bacterium]
MRHQRKGRRLGRSSSHRQAMLRNLAASLFLTEGEFDSEIDENIPKVKGRVVTTVPKAKEARRVVERCITIARKVLPHQEEAEQYGTTAHRHRDEEEYKRWRQSEDWRKWSQAMAPVVAARRRAMQILGDKEAVRILFDTVAPRFVDRPGGYTRILRLTKPRLGDAGERAILEFVGVHDREIQRSEKPAFEEEEAAPESQEEAIAQQEEPQGEATSEESAQSESSEQSEAGQKPAE